MYSQLRVSALAIIGSVGLAGCAGGGLDVFGGAGSSDVTTSSVAQTQAQRVDPACGNLAVEIDALRREGVADKVDRAAAKKYKMTSADLAKASQLNKANGEFQSKCSTLPRTAAVPDATVAATAAATKAAAPAAKAAAKSAAATATR
jgi:hypothetical protein